MKDPGGATVYTTCGTERRSAPRARRARRSEPSLQTVANCHKLRPFKISAYLVATEPQPRLVAATQSEPTQTAVEAHCLRDGARTVAEVITDRVTQGDELFSRGAVAAHPLGVDIPQPHVASPPSRSSWCPPALAGHRR